MDILIAVVGSIIIWFLIVAVTKMDHTGDSIRKVLEDSLKDVQVTALLQNLDQRLRNLESMNTALKLKTLENHLKIEFVDSKTVQNNQPAHYVKKSKEKSK
jgi:hypothetical protein